MPKRTASVGHDMGSNARDKDNSAGLERVSGESELGSKTLRDLIFLGRVSRNVEILGHTFELQTLNAMQQKEVYSELMDGEDARVSEIKPIILSKSITAINGALTSDLAANEGIDIFDIISSWQVNLIDRLYDEYEKMVADSNKEVSIDSVKK